MTLRNLGRWAILPLLLIISLEAAGAAVRLVDAVKNADKETIRDLIKQRVDVNSPEPDGTTALHWAARIDCNAP